jgi:flagellar biogenesis protein FliO
MFVPRFLLRFRALACCAALAATQSLADETTAPAALPAWPDQAQSIYSQRAAAPTKEPAAQAIQPATPAKFEAREPIIQIAAPPASEQRRLAPPRERRLSRTAKHSLAAAEPELLPSFGMPFESLYKTGAALAVVLGLFLVFAALVRRGAKKTNSVLPEEVVSVLGRVPLAARQFAELVRVGNKLVLISVTQAGAEPLTEITDPVEIDRLVGLCRSRTKGSSTDEFDQIFRQLADESAPTGFLGHEVPRVDARLAAPADVYAAYRGGAQRG